MTTRIYMTVAVDVEDEDARAFESDGATAASERVEGLALYLIHAGDYVYDMDSSPERRAQVYDDLSARELHTLHSLTRSALKSVRRRLERSTFVPAEGHSNVDQLKADSYERLLRKIERLQREVAQ